VASVATHAPKSPRSGAALWRPTPLFALSTLFMSVDTDEEAENWIETSTSSIWFAVQ